MHPISGVLLHPKVTFALEYRVNNSLRPLRNCVLLPSVADQRSSIFFFLFVPLFLSSFFFPPFRFLRSKYQVENNRIERARFPRAASKCCPLRGENSRVGIGKSIVRGAFKFHADSPVELITGISVPPGSRCNLSSQLPQRFPAAQSRARCLNYPPGLPAVIATREIVERITFLDGPLRPIQISWKELSDVRRILNLALSVLAVVCKWNL